MERRTLGGALLGWLGWILLATPAHAQPDAMPLTVLDNRSAALIQPSAADSVLPRQYMRGPQSMVVADPPPPLEDPAPSIAAPAGAIALPNTQVPQAAVWSAPWTWQVVPDGLMFKNYLASNEEGRLGSQLYYDKKVGWTWDGSLGGHVGVLRYGTQDPIWPEGWQLDADGVALPRLDSNRDMVSTDFRIGFPFTHREGPWEVKFGYYHLSSHLGDMYMLSHPDAVRLNYVREQLVLGVAYRPIPDLRFYGEANWAFHEDGGAQPWEFQFGIDYSPAQPSGFCGAPFAAINSKIFQDLNYGGNVTFEAGWQWRGPTGHTFRTGLQYFDGYSFQRQFYNQYQQFIGAGVWYDF
ncbi:MAG: DUF1207 domain-containing protein [Thermoguttaceae bacterium]